ncbi:MAG: DHH family phosphoesterase [Candidatus Paceibacterota bacterium]|jgi:phosphoesterase RecJ-like protein
MTHTIPNSIKEKAPLILAEIKKAKSILLHCHPSPDPDSVGSALATKFALEQLGKKATVIKGDSEIPPAFMHFRGAKDILMKAYWEIDPTEYDLFIIVDSAISGVSRLKEVKIPDSLKVINIDHHRTNVGDGFINIVEPSYPAVAQLLFDLFKEMNIKITPEIAENLFMGIYTDTGGFKYESVTSATFEVASELVGVCPNISRTIAKMENSNTLGDIAFQAAALSSVELTSNNKVAFSVIPYSVIQEKKIPDVSISAGMVSPVIRTIAGLEVIAVIIEARPNKIKMSFRSGNSGICDVSKLAVSLGGGGHKAAAGASIEMPLVDAKKLVVEKIKELYNL